MGLEYFLSGHRLHFLVDLLSKLVPHVCNQSQCRSEEKKCQTGSKTIQMHHSFQNAESWHNPILWCIFPISSITKSFFIFVRIQGYVALTMVFFLFVSGSVSFILWRVTLSRWWNSRGLTSTPFSRHTQFDAVKPMPQSHCTLSSVKYQLLRFAIFGWFNPCISATQSWLQPQFRLVLFHGYG